MKNHVFILAFLFFCSLAWGAQETCTVATPTWIDRTNADGSGYYFDIMRAVFETNGYKVEYKIVPWNRAMAMVEKNEADLMLGVFYNPESPDALRFVKWPFDIEETVVVYKKTVVKKWNGTKTLENQKVLWNRGYNYYKFLDIKMDWFETDDVPTGLALLALDRTRFFMVGINGLLTMKGKPLDKNIYEMQTVIEQGLLPLFSKNEKGKKLGGLGTAPWEPC